MLPRPLTLYLLSLLLLVLPAGVCGQSVLSPVVQGHYLVVYRGGLVPSDAAARMVQAGATLVTQHRLLGMAVVKTASAEARARLAADPAVSAVVADRLVTGSAIRVQVAPATDGPDSLYNSPQGWAVRLVGGSGSLASFGPWTITRGAGIRIAILDSGIDPTHPDLAPNVALNLSEIDQTSLPSACDDGSPMDQTGHGTWTASLAAGALGPKTGMVAGVAPEAAIFNIKVLERLPGAPSTSDPTGCVGGQAGGLLSWVLQGIEDAVAQRADIISMSLGSLVDITAGDGAGLKALFDQATYAAAQAGVVLIASAGNDGLNLGTNSRYLELPAQARNVVATVAATNPACAEDLTSGSVCASGPVTLPYYSNFGPSLNALAAPGGSYPEGAGLTDPAQPTGWIAGACASANYGCFGLGKTPYVQAMGTSASAPLTAGVAALLWSAHPQWHATDVIAALRASAVTYPQLPVGMVSAAGLLKPADATASPILTQPLRFIP